MQYSKLIVWLLFLGWNLTASGDISAQCDLLQIREVNQIARASFPKKSKLLNQRNAKLLDIKGDKEKCEYRTYTACQNYISNSQWHWTEIVSFNSCDEILTYSTSDQAHFAELKKEFLKKYKPIGIRTYDGLQFDVYQNKRGQVVEIDEHPNPQGLTFYLMNVMPRSRKSTR